jgi:hypothetical protein
MTADGQNGKKIETVGHSLSLSEQTHLQILDYFHVAEKSEHAAIRDAAIELAKGASRYQQNQGARLSPTVSMVIALLMLILAGVSSWYFFVYYPGHAYVLSVIAIGLALVGACLLAMYSGQLTQANFVSVVEMVWSKITGMLSKSQGETTPNGDEP